MCSTQRVRVNRAFSQTAPNTVHGSTVGLVDSKK